MRRGLLLLGLLLVTLTGLALAQEATPDPAWPTETPAITPTMSFTDTPLPTATDAPLPTHTPLPTPTTALTGTAIPTVEATVETTAETTAEVTETPTSTPSPTATGTSTETPAVTATLTETATGTPLPPEPELRPVILGDFDAGYPGDWLLGTGWSWESVQNEGILQLLNSPEAAVLQWGDLLNVTLSARFQMQSGGLRLSVRQSAAGSYSAVIDSGGLLRLYRGEEELASAFVGAAAAGQWRTLRLSAMADVVRVALDGLDVLAVADTSPLPPGAMTLAGAGSSTLWIGDYRVERPLAELEAETRSVAALAFGSLAGQNSSAIVFTSSRDGDTEIFILDPAVCDGIVDCPATQLTFNAVVDSDPVLSPDGSTIAFTSLRDGNYELYLMNADGSGPVRLTSNSASDKDPTWAPDGSRIAFTSDRTGHYEIYVINLVNCGPGADCPAVPLTTSVYRSSEPAWHGSRIAYNSFEVGPSGEIWVMNEDGSGKQQLTNSNSIDGMPTWSPDGSEIAFVSNRYTNYDVVKLNYSQCATPPNCPVTRLTTAAAYDYHPAWSPDGSQIAFTSDPSASAQVIVMNADGTNQVRLTYTGTNGNPQWWGPQCPTEGAMMALGADGGYCAVPTLNVIVVDQQSCLLADAITMANNNGAAPLGSSCTLSRQDTSVQGYVLEIAPAEIVVSAAAEGMNGLPIITSGRGIVIRSADGLPRTIRRDAVAPFFRIFEVAPGASLTLDNATVSGGSVEGDGGGIYNAGTLTLQNNSGVERNRATGNGGGVYNVGTVTITSSRIQENVISNVNGYGGGIFSAALTSTQVTNSCVVYNTASLNHGGGIFTQDQNLAESQNWWGDRLGATVLNAPIGAGDAINQPSNSLPLQAPPPLVSGCLNYSNLLVPPSNASQAEKELWDRINGQWGQPGLAAEIYVRTLQILGLNQPIDQLDMLGFIYLDAAFNYEENGELVDLELDRIVQAIGRKYYRFAGTESISQVCYDDDEGKIIIAMQEDLRQRGILPENLPASLFCFLGPSEWYGEVVQAETQAYRIVGFINGSTTDAHGNPINSVQIDRIRERVRPILDQTLRPEDDWVTSGGIYDCGDWNEGYANTTYCPIEYGNLSMGGALTQSRFSDPQNQVNAEDTLENDEYIIPDGLAEPQWVYDGNGLVDPEKRLRWQFAVLYDDVADPFLVLTSAQRNVFYCPSIVDYRVGYADGRIWIVGTSYYYPVCASREFRPVGAINLPGNRAGE